MTRPFPTAALAVALALAAPASAKDLGVRGATWPVAEPDLLAQIEARLVEMERSGEMARLQRQARDRARMKLEEPDPVPGIAPAREERSRLFDPASTVARVIRTPDGALIA
ncbi:MAG: type-F conjugative transfer system protein TraW, partial [Rhodospirillaceae bacterium]|nr:type-F conjugative transfer system protein TraW [Rhodospirillaceae bacterium]